MPVQQQTPYIEYECNGTTTVFPLSFDCDDSAYLIVKLDGKNALTSDWLLSSGSVVFQVAPKTGSKLSIKRNLPLERLTNYGSYDNSMRPQVLNSDFDNIWFKLQEHNYQIQYSGTGLENISLIANQALEKADQAGNDIQLINNHLVKFSNSAGYVYARQVVGRDGQNQENLNTEVRPITTGGTGATNIEGARQNFEVYSKSQVDVLIKTGGETSIIGISGGGTGAETVEQARTNLDIYSKEEVDTEKLGKNETAIKAKALENPLTINGVKVDVGGELNISGDRIGRIQWYPIRREKIPVGELALDGFIYNRADYPDLWALVESGFYEAIAEAAWQADPRKRGKFSDGDGSTTFRVPDINGVQESSIQNLFVRGSFTDGLAGRVQDNAMMAITGSILPSDPNTGVRQGFGKPGIYTGAFRSGPSIQGINGMASVYLDSDEVTTIEFDSSRMNIPHDTEIRPRSIYGVYTIIAKSSFIQNPPEGTKAAVLTGGNTFDGNQVINGDVEIKGNLEFNSKTQFFGQYKDVKSDRAINVLYTNYTPRIRFVYLAFDDFLSDGEYPEIESGEHLYFAMPTGIYIVYPFSLYGVISRKNLVIEDWLESI